MTLQTFLDSETSIKSMGSDSSAATASNWALLHHFGHDVSGYHPVPPGLVPVSSSSKSLESRRWYTSYPIALITVQGGIRLSLKWNQADHVLQCTQSLNPGLCTNLSQTPVLVCHKGHSFQEGNTDPHPFCSIDQIQHNFAIVRQKNKTRAMFVVRGRGEKKKGGFPHDSTFNIKSKCQ